MSILVTGASRGIGLHTVSRILSQEASTRVVAASRSVLESPELIEAQKTFGTERLTLFPLDLTDENSIQNCAQVLKGEPCSAIYHVAGLLHPSGKGENTVRRLKMDEMDQVYRTTVSGPAILTGALWANLSKAARESNIPSKVVAIGAGVGSVQGNAAGGWYSYRCSKTALNQLVKNIAIEGWRSNIHTMCMYPEMVDTKLSQPYASSNPYPLLRTPEETAKKILQMANEMKPEDTGRFVNLWSEEDIPF